MSWSTSYSAKLSIVVDACHRVAARFVLSSLHSQSEESVLDLCKLYAENNIMHHYIVIEREILPNLAAAMNLVQKMRAKIAIGNDGVSGTFLSIVCPMAMYEDIKSHIQFPVDVLYISIPNNHLVVKNADIADAVLGSIQVNPLIRSIGVTDLTSVDDIDAFMLTHKHHDKLQFISLHISTLPNLYSMVVELAHSFGWNCLLTVEPSVLTQSHSLPLYTDLAEKYKVPPFVVIFKCVLQLGALMCFPVQEMEKIAATFAVDVGRLGHPFVHRKEFVSSSKVISLIVSDPDMDSVIEASEEEELKRDLHRIPQATTCPSSLYLQFAPSLT